MGKTRRWYRNLCDQHFWSFVKICGGSVNQGADAIPEIHGIHCNYLQDDAINVRIGIGKPRDWRKSTIYTKWNAAWRYLQDPEERQLFAAENERIGADLLYWVQKQFLFNKVMRELYPDRLAKVTSTFRRQARWSGTQCDMPREGIYSEPSFRAIGVGGAAQSGHYTTIHIDDLVGKKAMDSDLVMEGVFKWFDNVPELLYQPDPNSPDPSRVQIIGTHWAVGDFFDYVMLNYPEYTFFITPCLKDTELKDKDNKKWIQNPHIEHGESNWPQKFPTEYYENMRANPEKQMIFWSQHMNNPTKGSGLNKFDYDWLRWYYFEDIEINGEMVTHVTCEDDEERIPLREIVLYGMIDPGGFTELKHTKRGARLAMLIGGQARKSIKKFITWAWAGKFKNPNDFFDTFFNAHDEWSPRVWRMDNTTEKFMYHDLLLEKKERKKNYIRIHPLPKDPSASSKDKDILDLIVPISNGEFYLHRNMKPLINEIKEYPSFRKDLIDMMAKLYKTYLSRTPKQSIEDIQRRNRDKVINARQDCVY